jgi:hypothetical protein
VKLVAGVWPKQDESTRARPTTVTSQASTARQSDGASSACCGPTRHLNFAHTEENRLVCKVPSEHVVFSCKNTIRLGSMRLYLAFPSVFCNGRVVEVGRRKKPASESSSGLQAQAVHLVATEFRDLSNAYRAHCSCRWYRLLLIRTGFRASARVYSAADEQYFRKRVIRSQSIVGNESRSAWSLHPSSGGRRCSRRSTQALFLLSAFVYTTAYATLCVLASVGNRPLRGTPRESRSQAIHFNRSDSVSMVRSYSR